jgi:hypothetical protein
VAAADDMTPSRPSHLEHAFDRIGRQLLDQHPGDERGRMLHAVGLKTAGRFYAFTARGELVVKLPAARVNELIATGVGRPCDPSKGRPMRQWVRLTPADETACAAYVVEARNFVTSHQSRSARMRTANQPRQAPREGHP